MNLKHVNNFKNCSNNTLDLFFTNFELAHCKKAIEPLSRLNKYHDAINIEIPNSNEIFLITQNKNSTLKKLTMKKLTTS